MTGALPIGLVVLVALLALRGPHATKGAAGGGAFGGGPLTNDPGANAVVGDAFDTGEADWFLAFGMKADAANLPDSRHEEWTPTQKAAAAKYHRDRAYAFYRQVWLPASRVPVTSLTQEDFTLALKFLANKLNRVGVPWTYGQTKAVNDFNDAGEIAFMNAILPIASALTLGIGNAKGRITDAEKAYFDAVAAAPQFIDAGNGDLVIKESPTPGVDYSVDDPVLAAIGAPFDYARQSIDSPFINFFGPCIDFGFDPIVFDFGRVFYRCQLFRSSNETTAWQHPWVATEFGYASDGKDGSSLTDKLAKPDIVYRHARCYRALDVLGAMLKPYYRTVLVNATPDAEGNINVANTQAAHVPISGTFAYKVGTAELWGCVLPSAPVDNATALDGLAHEARQAIASSLVTPAPTPAVAIGSTLVTPPPSSPPPPQQVATLVTTPPAPATHPLLSHFTRR